MIEIHGPQIDEQDVLKKARQNMSSRHELAPTHAAAALGEQRAALRSAIEKLRAKAALYGAVDEKDTADSTHSRGVSARLFVKRLVKKLIQRHLDQQREVNAELMEVLDRMSQYLDSHKKDL